MNSKQRVFLSGLGVVCPAGNVPREIISYLSDKRNSRKYCAIGKPRLIRTESGDLRCYVHQIESIAQNDNFRNFDRHSEYAAIAAESALMDSDVRLEPYADDRKGVRLGTFVSIATSMSKFDESVLAHGPRRCNIGVFPSTVMSAAASRLSILKSIRGANSTLCSGKNSGFDAIGYSFLEIRNGQKDVMVCGGSDALSDQILLGLAGQDMLFEEHVSVVPSQRTEKIIPSEGACIVVLSNKKPSKRNYSEIKAFQTGFTTARRENIQARSSDLNRSINLALASAELSSIDINVIMISSYFNQYDLDSEIGAIQMAMSSALNNVPILALKKHLGEGFSAFGAMLYVTANYLLTNQVKRNFITNSNVNSLWCGTPTIVSNVMLVAVDSFGHYSVAILNGERKNGK